jgi:hypothetical protein
MKATIEQLAEKLGKTVWVKGDLKRIYLNDAGYNTKKMSTKTFIWQDENGEFKVSCRIDCPSQHPSWIDSQEQEVKDGIYTEIDNALAELETTIEEPVKEPAEEDKIQQPVKNVFIGTGKEINDSGLFKHIQPNDKETLIWIKRYWGFDKKENFAPIVEVSFDKNETHTHKISNTCIYFTLPKNTDGNYMFEDFINKHISIEKL